MKRIFFGILTATALSAVALLTVHTVNAAKQPNDIINDQQISVIRSRCSDIQASLNRIHESDKVERVNKGYLYKAIILDKLMTPLNQRIAANQIDGGELVAIAARYNQAFEKFDVAYRTYERSLSAVILIDCTKQPTAFYDQLATAYDNRKQLSTADAELIDLTRKFKVEAKKVFETVQTTKETE